MSLETIKRAPREALIAVMGPTGAGKSTFINLASNSQLRIGESLMSCTDKIEHSRSFNLDDSVVTLVDTPGFDDTTKSDAEVLNTVCDYLSSQYKEGRLLQGIIYFHRISDNRMSGSATRNLRFFQELCGPDALANSIIVTNMWGLVDPALGAAREAELKSKDVFFAPAIAAGARVLRHDASLASAHAIVRAALLNTPRALRVQRELVDERRRVVETAAGAALLQELAALEQQHLREVEELEADFADAVRRKDEESRQEIEDARQKLAAERAKLEAQKRRLLEFRLAAVQQAEEERREADEAQRKLAAQQPEAAGQRDEPDEDPAKAKSPRSFWARLGHAFGAHRLLRWMGCFRGSD